MNSSFSELTLAPIVIGVCKVYPVTGHWTVGVTLDSGRCTGQIDWHLNSNGDGIHSLVQRLHSRLWQTP